jgi:hypothetical protein
VRDKHSRTDDDSQHVAGRRVVTNHQVDGEIGELVSSGELHGVDEEVVADMGGPLPASPVEGSCRASPVRRLVRTSTRSISATDWSTSRLSIGRMTKTLPEWQDRTAADEVVRNLRNDGRHG